MGLFDFAKVCLFSEINGIVTLKGKPVAGVEITRRARINDTEHTEKTVTDQNGHYHFDAKFTHSVNKILPMEPVISQTMIFTYLGKEYLGWRGVKHNYDVNGEIEGEKPLKLSCELTEEPKVKHQELASNIDGICHW